MSTNSNNSNDKNASKIDIQRLRSLAAVDVVHFLLEVGSTNDWASQVLSTKRASSRTELFIAQSQTDGRGRGAKTWHSTLGSLTMSLVVPCSFELSNPRRAWIPLAVGWGVCQAINIASSSKRWGLRRALASAIKWPNDVMVSNKKVAGVLVESSANSGRLVIGCGINVNNSFVNSAQDIKPPTSLLDQMHSENHSQSNSSIDLTGMAADVVGSIIAALVQLESDPQALARSVQQHDWLLNRAVEWQQTEAETTERTRGTAVGIAEDGSLQLVIDGKQQKIVTGSILALE